MSSEVAEQVTMAVPAERAYAAVADVRRMGRRSPECFAVWVYARRAGRPRRFVGFNRRGGYVWFTTCRVVVDEPGAEFAFDVTSFGLPVSRWGYRFAPRPDGGTDVTEYWDDRRGRAVTVLGRVFTGRAALNRPEVNRAGMRTTLTRLKAELEAGP
jgi:Polyketide cyclase / dehydrase and lipid transport